MRLVPLLRLFLRGYLALPAGLLRLRAGDPPTNDRGTALDRHVWVMIWLERRFFGDLTKGTPTQARAGMARSIGIVASRPEHPLEVREDRVPGGPKVRVYRGGGPPRPLLVYLHGGGWVQGDLDTHDALCRRLAAEAGRVVVSVDYRLAPEHPFPAGLDDTLAALRWARAHAGDLGATERIEVGGDSAGGNLAAAACIALRDGGEPLPALQLLIYPGLDQTRAFPSHTTLGQGYMLTAADIDWFQAHYAYGDPYAPLASPFHVTDVTGLPPAIVTTAGFDPLRDEGEAYAARLAAAGIPVTSLHEPDLVHGYANMDGLLPAANRALERIFGALRAAG